ncbi:Multifunctional protein ADE2 [Trichinella nelsoni]|uniref:Multifunctional protein ADE2 n=1 Tax=Trichinella nelsoni TaxID=6336 RepID=A0A0V0SH13_9BILA|nr:Multifunctional protein ADE2 [Trichinella nelsoni]
MEPDEQGIPQFSSGLEDCKNISEGKTKTILQISDSSFVLVQSKDFVTAFSSEQRYAVDGKAALSNATTCTVFEYLNMLGIRTHYMKKHSDTEFIAKRCVMLPLEWVVRRVASGSYLRRNPAVKEGYMFYPPKVEIFYKDDAAGDHLWSRETLIESGLTVSGITIEQAEVNLMTCVCSTVFEVLERAWLTFGCTLVDLKVEFGVDPLTGKCPSTFDMAVLRNIIVADVIDSDSWLLWAGDDNRLQLDKQFYRDLTDVQEKHLIELKGNYTWVVEKLKQFRTAPVGRAIVLMACERDSNFCEEIRAHLLRLGVPCFLRVTSAHKSTNKTMKMLTEFESGQIPTVFIVVSGNSNGLAALLAGNTPYPVINCSPVNERASSEDIRSSICLPAAGVGCTTAISAESAALHAASILGLSDHVVWGHLRVKKLLNHIAMMKSDRAFRLGNVTSMEKANR